MKTLLLTLASDQHAGFRFSVQWSNRCLEFGDIDANWLVVDDGEEPCEPLLRDSLCHQIDYIKLPHDNIRGMDSLRRNLVRALKGILEYRCTPDTIVFFLEDDWLRADWYRDALQTFEDHEHLMLLGETQTRYYHVGTRRHHTFRPNGRSALSCTAMRYNHSLIQWLIDRAESDRTIMLDDRLWNKGPLQDHEKLLHPESVYNVGIKGLPGKPGLGMGHRLDAKHPADTDMSLLRQWIGDDVEHFAPYFAG